jgi:hypothetical protein
MESKYWAYKQRTSDGTVSRWSAVCFSTEVTWPTATKQMEEWALKGGAMLVDVRTLSQDEYWTGKLDNGVEVSR